MKPLRKNNGGYFGETIDVRKVLGDIDRVAVKTGFSKEIFFKNSNFEFPAYKRILKEKPSGAVNIYLSSGIHGDEPAGPLASLKMIEEDNWPAGANLYL